jgi:hypothetical protein
MTLCVPCCTYFPLLPLLIEPIRFFCVCSSVCWCWLCWCVGFAFGCLCALCCSRSSRSVGRCSFRRLSGWCPSRSFVPGLWLWLVGFCGFGCWFGAACRGLASCWCCSSGLGWFLVVVSEFWVVVLFSSPCCACGGAVVVVLVVAAGVFPPIKNYCNF